MYLARLSVSNYKNIRQLEAEFSPSVNLFLGHNGMGKTNLLDAIYYLSFCKSHTHTPDGIAVREGEPVFLIQGHYEEEGKEEEILCAYKTGEQKTVKRNKKEYTRLSEHIGLLPLVIISPQDMKLIQGGSEERRRFMDIVISQYNRTYLNGLIQYNKALRQRNNLLRQKVEDGLLFEAIERMMVQASRPVYEARQEFIEQLIPLFNDYYRCISNSQETVSLNYVSQLHKEQAAEVLDRYRETDRKLGYTSGGIHRDDLVFRLRGQALNYTGSQGQQKTAVLAVKLAQYTLLANHTRTMPMLLLDDIFDKLDAGRVKQIMELVSGAGFGQIFITDTNRQHLDALVESCCVPTASFHVEEGELSRLES
ncbi:MAG: DNA replication and repair protein RecF [Tannerellaceae bacterium]|jgi:DNA replication and repair protein RecF|nr:DNA replication and repair protein RecF [Tannerellaceae bacterium]